MRLTPVGVPPPRDSRWLEGGGEMQTSSRLKVGLSMPPTGHSSSASSARKASLTRLWRLCMASPVTTMDGRIGAEAGGTGGETGRQAAGGVEG